MKQLNLRTLFKAVMVLALAGATLVPQFSSVQADEFACGGQTYFVTKWGMGSTCQQAESNCYLFLLGGGYDVCERVLISNGNACQFSEPSFGSCYWDSGQWKVDCSITHKCEIYQW